MDKAIFQLKSEPILTIFEKFREFRNFRIYQFSHLLIHKTYNLVFKTSKL